MINLAIFASGNGSNAENITRYFSGNRRIRVVLILSNRKEAFVHTRAQALGIPSRSFCKVEFEGGGPVLDALQAYSVDFIILAGFLLKVSPPILEAYPDRILNIHPALLPKHGGKGMYGDRVHRAVVDAGDTESGITIHYVNEHYDEGAILFQARCQVLPTDSADDVAQKVHELEYLHFPKVIEAAVLKAFPISHREM
ncbi:MAG TPA: phosphoribosylglycinamide formyltransferase [Petrimonas sp.]|nr:phosphoribosylglycinamide formyltransferase [Petrimonas sp.]